MATKRTPAEALLAHSGGLRGLVYTSAPVIVFVPVLSVFGVLAAVGAALGAAAVVLGWQLYRRESARPALSGFVAVMICATIVLVTGDGKDYFLLGIWKSLFWAVVFAVSVVIRRPVTGYLWAWLSGQPNLWRRQRKARYAFDAATIAWALVFGARYVVQNHLYATDETGWLGFARIAMGWPLTAVAALGTFLAIRTAQQALSESRPDGEVPISSL
ncbi:DUF3159 domain-containing protein [soil metagenome]